MYSDSFLSKNTQQTNTNTKSQYGALGANFGYNQYLDELGQKLSADQSILRGLGEYSAQLDKMYKLDRVFVPSRTELTSEKTQKTLVKYNQLTFGQKEAFFKKLVKTMTSTTTTHGASNNNNAEDDENKRIQNLMFDLLFLKQTPQIVSPRYVATPTHRLRHLGAKINTLANDPAVLEALAQQQQEQKQSSLSLRNCTLFLLSATTGILVGYVAMHSLGPMSFFPGLHKDALTIGFKVYTIVRSATQGQSLKEALEIMARTGARELLQYSSASMLIGLTSSLTTTTTGDGTFSFVEKHLGYMACRMVTFMTNNGIQVLMQNIKFIQPSTREMALAKERTAQQKLQQEQQDFIDLCNEIQTGYRTPLRILKNSFKTFKISLDAKTKRRPYLASMLIVIAASALSNNFLDVALGEGASLFSKLPFGLYDAIPAFLDTSLIKETVKRTYLFPFVFRTVNELVPLKTKIMAQMTTLLKMSPDEYITMEKIIERKLTATMLFKNIVRFLTNAAVTVTQEDFIRGGVSYDFVGAADTLYNNLEGTLRQSLDNGILALENVQDHMYFVLQEATRVFTHAADLATSVGASVTSLGTSIGESLENTLVWFQGALDTLYTQISTILASSQADTQVDQKATIMDQISDNLKTLQTIRGENLKNINDIAESITRLEAAFSANKDILFAGQINQLTGDLAHLRATIDLLQGQNKEIDDLTNAYENDLKARADSTTFLHEGAGAGPGGTAAAAITEALSQFGHKITNFLGGATGPAANALEVASTAQKQIADNRAHYEAYTEMTRLHQELKGLLPGLTDTNLPARTESLSLADIQKQTLLLQEASARMQAHQENIKRRADNVNKLQKITEKATDELCQKGILPFWNKTCKQLAEEDLRTLDQYAESWKGFEDSMTAALNAATATATAGATTLPPIPPYPFKINPSLKRFVSAWNQMDTLMKNTEEFKVFEDFLKESNLTLSNMVTALINDKSKAKNEVFNTLQSTIKSAYEVSKIDKTRQQSVSAQANLQQVSMSQAYNLYVKNDPLASSRTKSRMRDNFLQTTNNAQAMMDANRTLHGLHEQVVSAFRNLAKGGGGGGAPSLDEIKEAVAQSTKKTDEVAATQDELEKAIIMDYTNHVFKTSVSSQVEKGENPDVSDFSQVEITLPAIRAFNERNTKTMFDSLLGGDNALFKEKVSNRLAQGPILDMEMAVLIEEEYHELLNNFLLPPDHPHYDPRANQIIRDTLLENSDNVTFQSLLKMRNGLDDMIRQQVVTAGLALSSVVPAVGPVVAGASAATSLLYTAVETATGLESSIDNSMKFFDYFARFAKTDNHATLNLARNTFLQVQKGRIHLEGVANHLIHGKISKYVQAKMGLGTSGSGSSGSGSSGNNMPLEENTINFKNFIATMVLTGKTSETFQNVILTPIFKDRTTSGWNLNNFLNNIPFLGTAKVGSETLFDMTDAIVKGALADDTHMTYLLFGHGFDFERMSTLWKSSTAHADSWFSWAARSTSLSDDVAKFFTSRESEQFNILFAFYSANKGQIHELCHSGGTGIGTKLAFLCPNTEAVQDQPLLRV